MYGKNIIMILYIYVHPTFHPCMMVALKLLACYRKATADVYAVAINHKVGWSESKRRSGRLTMKQLEVYQNAVLTYNCTNTPCRHGCVLRYKPC